MADIDMLAELDAHELYECEAGHNAGHAETRAEVERLTALTATCTCTSWPPEGPQPDCPIHGAIRAFNKAIAEVEHHKQRANEAARLSAEARDRNDDLVRQIEDLREQVGIVEEGRTDVIVEAHRLEAERDQAHAEVERLKVSLAMAHEAWLAALEREAKQLNQDYERKFPGVTANEDGLTIDKRALPWMKGWKS
jgi:hypothetical protein